MTTLTRSLPTREFRRFARFLAIGTLGTLIDFSLLALLKGAGLPTLAANSLSFSAGLVNNFLLNRRWTFADRPRSGAWRRFARFALVSLAGLGLNNALVLAFETPFATLLGRPELGYLPAKVLATGLVLYWNYFANRAWTFREPRS